MNYKEWFNKNKKTLMELKNSFERETKTRMSLKDFCKGTFKETKYYKKENIAIELLTQRENQIRPDIRRIDINKDILICLLVDGKQVYTNKKRWFKWQMQIYLKILEKKWKHLF